MKKYFSDIKLSYLNVVFLAIIAAIITALFNVIPIFKNTSFSDMAVYLDVWFVYALFIILNSSKWYEASIKCFLFFLISQPLIYLLEVPFNPMGFKLFDYYHYWFVITLLTIPGSIIAYQIKRNDWLSVLVLALSFVYFAYISVYYLNVLFNSFPRHLISFVFCLVFVLFFSLVLFEDKKKRIICILFYVLAFIIFFTINLYNNRSVKKIIELPSGHNWSCHLSSDIYADYEVDGNNIEITTKKNGSFIIDCINENEEMKSYNVVIDGQSVMIGDID